VDSGVIHRWSVFKRYSEFESLEKSIRQDFGWQLTSLSTTFPSKNSFTFDKLAADFLETRRRDLDSYWQSMITVDRITDFSRPHHCSNDLKCFLEVDANVSAKGLLDADAVSNTTKAPRRKTSVRPGSVRNVRSDLKQGVSTSQTNRTNRSKSNSSKSPSRPNSERIEKEVSAAGANESSAPPPAAPTPAAKATVAEPPEEVKQYLRMLKMGIPRMAVEQKMCVAGVDTGLLDRYGDADGGGGGGGSGGGGGGSSAPPPAPAPSSKSSSSSKPAAAAPPPAQSRRASNPMMAGGLLADLNKNRID
jgi:hypothetical protein